MPLHVLHINIQLLTTAEHLIQACFIGMLNADVLWPIVALQRQLAWWLALQGTQEVPSTLALSASRVVLPENLMSSHGTMTGAFCKR